MAFGSAGLWHSFPITLPTTTNVSPPPNTTRQTFQAVTDKDITVTHVWDTVDKRTDHRIPVSLTQCARSCCCVNLITQLFHLPVFQSESTTSLSVHTQTAHTQYVRTPYRTHTAHTAHSTQSESTVNHVGQCPCRPHCRWFPSSWFCPLLS